VPSSIAGLPSRKALTGCRASWRTARAECVPLYGIPTGEVASRTYVARKAANHPAESKNVESNGFALDGLYGSSSRLLELQPSPMPRNTSLRSLVDFSNRSERPPFAFYAIICIFGRSAQVPNPQ